MSAFGRGQLRDTVVGRVTVNDQDAARITTRLPLISIGTADDADLRVNDALVESHHARILFDGKRFSLEDLESRKNCVLISSYRSCSNRLVMYASVSSVLNCLFGADPSLRAG